MVCLQEKSGRNETSIDQREKDTDPNGKGRPIRKRNEVESCSLNDGEHTHPSCDNDLHRFFPLNT